MTGRHRETDDGPLVTIVVLNWNGWHDTLECLTSLRKLDYRKRRVVVVDNGSTDDSIVRLRGAYPDITILETGRNLGFAGGNNVGIRWALQQGSRYIWLLNNDTTAHPKALSSMVGQAEFDGQVGAVGCLLYYLDRPERLQAWGGGWVNLWLGLANQYSRRVRKERLDYLTAASLLLRGAALEQVGLLDEGFFMYWEDIDLAFRLRKAGWRMTLAEDAVVWHKESASLGHRSTVRDRYTTLSAIRFFRRHAPWPIVPILLGTSIRVLKRIAAGDWRRARTVLKAFSQYQVAEPQSGSVAPD